jgi:GAF domain-containing protein
MLSILCSQAAIALENHRARHQLTSDAHADLFEQYVAPRWLNCFWRRIRI